MIGNKRLEGKIMYTVSLEDLVPADNFYRQLDGFLDLRFLYKECKQLYGSTGKPSIDPVVFFKILLFGYFENIISDRELVRRASDSLGVRLYLGYDIDEELPWHSTISRTRKLYKEEIFEMLFDKVLEKCVEAGIVSGEHH
jgi:transposase